MRKTTRERLAEALKRDLGIDIKPYRLERNHDTRGECSQNIRWDGHGTKDGKPIRVGSFDTMGDCVKWGVVLQGVDYGFFEVTANEPAVPSRKP